MRAKSEPSTPRNLTPQSWLHDVIVSYTACILKDESRKTNNASHEEQVPPTVAKANGKIKVMQQPTVRIPDMFVGFCSLPPIVNRHYDSMKQDSDTFIRALSGFNKRETKIHIKADLAYYGAILYAFSEFHFRPQSIY